MLQINCCISRVLFQHLIFTRQCLLFQENQEGIRAMAINWVKTFAEWWNLQSFVLQQGTSIIAVKLALVQQGNASTVLIITASVISK